MAATDYKRLIQAFNLDVIQLSMHANDLIKRLTEAAEHEDEANARIMNLWCDKLRKGQQTASSKLILTDMVITEEDFLERGDDDVIDNTPVEGTDEEGRTYSALFYKNGTEFARRYHDNGEYIINDAD